MADSVATRPFNNFRLAISDPQHFFGHEDILTSVERSPFQVQILLGGRRSGKSSILNVLHQNLLNAGSNKVPIAFPVLFDLQQERPESLDNFRYLLVRRLQEALISSKSELGADVWKGFRRFIRQFSGGEMGVFGLKVDVSNPETERCLIHEDFRQDLIKLLRELQSEKIQGVCFLLDGAEFIVHQEWANDAWSYLRALKDTDLVLKSSIGFILSGYRDLKSYQQRVGSPLLNIAEINWLTPLPEPTIQMLIDRRCEAEGVRLSSAQRQQVIKWAGCHPYLTQQMLNTLIDDLRAGKLRSPDSFLTYLVRQHDKDFSAWWDGETSSYGFGKREQEVYLALTEQRQATIEHLVEQTKFSFGEIADALEVLVGTGVIRQIDDEQYIMGAKLFEQWVTWN